ncbi:MAG: hypothetical protein IKI50_06540, partial [Clostridia bacterium]|nr:hypothetical protein [Clostridia bacterium]
WVRIPPGPGITKKGFYTVFQLDQKTLFDFQLPVPISTIVPLRVSVTDLQILALFLSPLSTLAPNSEEAWPLRYFCKRRNGA